MPLRQLKLIYEKRRNVLTGILRKDNKINKSRKDQINGAISEIDILLKTIETLREQEIADNQKIDFKMQGSKDFLNNVSIIKKISSKLNVKFDNSQTKQNLINIFVRKCEIKAKYEFFAKLAKNEGYEHLAQTFLEYAEHEKQHARLVYKYLGWVHNTKDNVREAADMENNFHSNIYTEFEKTAVEENFKDAAELFKQLAQIDAEHEKKFLKILRMFHENKVFRSEHVVRWKCRNCGNIIEGKDAPKKCTVCKESQSHFEKQEE